MNRLPECLIAITVTGFGVALLSALFIDIHRAILRRPVRGRRYDCILGVHFRCRQSGSYPAVRRETEGAMSVLLNPPEWRANGATGR
jgi:hypothetical protein